MGSAYESIFKDVSNGLATSATVTTGHNVSMNLDYVDIELVSEFYSLQQRAKASAIVTIKSRIEQAEQRWEDLRVKAVEARNAFNRHRSRELEFQNDVNKATSRMFNANQAVASLEQTELDPYSSREDRQKHEETIVAYRRTATEAERLVFDANGTQQSYYNTAEKLRSEYVAANDAFRAVDVEINTLKRHLASREGDAIAA